MEHDITGKAQEIDVEDDWEEELPDYPYDIDKQTGTKKRGRKKSRSEVEAEKMGQMSLFGSTNENIKTDDIILELHDLDLSTTTPIDAMNILYKMQLKLKERM